MRIFTVLSLIAVVFLLIASVSASDANDTQISSTGDGDEILMPESDLGLGDDAGTFSGLSEEIGKGGNVTLKHKHYDYDSGSTISITEDNTVIEGNGAVIDMKWATLRPFYVSASGVTIKDLTIKNALNSYEGGSFYFNAPGTVLNCTFTDNNAYEGGALYFRDGGKVADCTFKDNMASYGGGGAVSMASGVIENCIFTGNYAYIAGAVNMNSGSIENCCFEDNSASTECGAVEINSGTLKNCSFTNNYAKTDFGAVKINSGNVSSCTFTDNWAYDVGALSISSGIVENCSFKQNRASYKAGAVAMISGTFRNCSFLNNSADDGGAIRSYDFTNITGCSFTDNSGDNGGAVFFDKAGQIADCSFTANGAASEGGAVCFKGNGSTINCSFTDNVADLKGGAILYCANGITINCTFAGNSLTDGDGGAVYFTASATLSNCSFKRNTATGTGGAVYCNAKSSVTHSSFTDCSALYGGAMYFRYGSLSAVENCNFTNCSAGHSGAAIKSRGNCSIINCTFKDCTSKYSDGSFDLDTLDIRFFDNNYYYGGDNFFGFVVPDDLENNVSVEIDGNPYELIGPRDTSNPYRWVWGRYDGKVGYYVGFRDLNPGTYEVVISYPGDSVYAPYNFTRTVTVHKSAPVDPKIIASNVKAIYSAGSCYTIRVYDWYGELADGAVVIISGGISKALKTENGIAKFKISQGPGTYRMTISALGRSIERTLTVKHIVTLKTVTVKKSAKKLVLQVSLAKVNGKYLKNKKITFKFNGKKYTAKTNKKGIAKVTVKSSVLKKLKVGKKVAYQATYLKDTVKKTAKIKK